MSKKRDLLFSITKKDFKVTTFKSGGPGGQHQNKTDSGVRIVHKESGAMGESREDRSQHRNKVIAFRRLTESAQFKTFVAQKSQEAMSGISIEESVKESMKEENLKIEVKDENGIYKDIKNETDK